MWGIFDVSLVMRHHGISSKWGAKSRKYLLLLWNSFWKVEVKQNRFTEMISGRLLNVTILHSDETNFDMDSLSFLHIRTAVNYAILMMFPCSVSEWIWRSHHSDSCSCIWLSNSSDVLIPCIQNFSGGRFWRRCLFRVRTLSSVDRRYAHISWPASRVLCKWDLEYSDMTFIWGDFLKWCYSVLRHWGCVDWSYITLAVWGYTIWRGTQ